MENSKHAWYSNVLPSCVFSESLVNMMHRNVTWIFILRIALFFWIRTIDTHVTAAGLRAGNTRYTFVMAGVGPAVVHDGSLRHLVHYGDEYYFSTSVGQARTHLTERWRALFARYSSLRGCWPSGFPINIMRIITKSGDQHWSGFSSGYGYPGKIWCKRKQRVCFIYK